MGGNGEDEDDGESLVFNKLDATLTETPPQSGLFVTVLYCVTIRSTSNIFNLPGSERVSETPKSTPQYSRSVGWLISFTLTPRINSDMQDTTTIYLSV
jgi:hypothetical protein